MSLHHVFQLWSWDTLFSTVSVFECLPWPKFQIVRGWTLEAGVLFITSWDLIYSCSKLFLPCLILSVVWCSDSDLRFSLRGLKAQPTVFAIKRELFRQELAFRRSRNVPIVCSSGCTFSWLELPELRPCLSSFESCFCFCYIVLLWSLHVEHRRYLSWCQCCRMPFLVFWDINMLYVCSVMLRHFASICKQQTVLNFSEVGLHQFQVVRYYMRWWAWLHVWFLMLQHLTSIHNIKPLECL